MQAELVLEFEELLPPFLRSKLRSGHKVVYPGKKKRIEWLRQEHESYDVIGMVFERKARQVYTQQSEDNNDKFHHQHTEHHVTHTAVQVSHNNVIIMIMITVYC